VAIAFLAVATVACGSGGSNETSSGAAAAKQLSSAAAAMQATSGYRFDAGIGAPGAGVEVAGEFQAPDRLHENITIAGRPSAEVVFIGTNAFAKDPATGLWRNRVQSQTPTTPTDVRAAFGALAKARGVTQAADGTYRFTIPAAATRELVGPNATGTVAGTAKLLGRDVASLSYHATVGGRPLDFRITYADVGTAPPVAQPATS